MKNNNINSQLLNEQHNYINSNINLEKNDLSKGDKNNKDNTENIVNNNLEIEKKEELTNEKNVIKDNINEIRDENEKKEIKKKDELIENQKIDNNDINKDDNKILEQNEQLNA